MQTWTELYWERILRLQNQIKIWHGCAQESSCSVYAAEAKRKRKGQTMLLSAMAQDVTLPADDMIPLTKSLRQK